MPVLRKCSVLNVFTLTFVVSALRLPTAMARSGSVAAGTKVVVDGFIVHP